MPYGTDVAAQPVLYEVTDSGVAILSLNRPERLNAWGGGIGSAFYAHLDRAEADPAVRVIVVTGKGRAFCAGADMGDLPSLGDSLSSAEGTDVGGLVGHRHPHSLTQVRKPVIAAINVSWILPRVVGSAVALDLLLSARVFDADEAARLGLVKEVVPGEQLMARTRAYAGDIAAHCAPSALAVIKKQVYDDATEDRFTASDRAEALMYESLQRPDLIEGITSFFEKRAPDFPPLTTSSVEERTQP